MKYGLTDDQWRSVEDLLLKPLWQAGATVWIFGSRARLTNQDFSDLDVLFFIPVEKVLPSGLISKILEDLENSNLPIKVDLVNEVDLAASYRQGVLKDRVLLKQS